MAGQFLKPWKTPSSFSPIHIGVVLNPIPKPSSKLLWWAMSEPGECVEIASSLLPLLSRLKDRRLWWLSLQPFGKVLVSPVFARGSNQIGAVCSSALTTKAASSSDIVGILGILSDAKAKQYTSKRNRIGADNVR
jgi:hypothetical protein